MQYNNKPKTINQAEHSFDACVHTQWRVKRSVSNLVMDQRGVLNVRIMITVVHAYTIVLV